VVVNAVCIMMLFKIKRLDRKLIPKPGEETKALSP
jgi:hypothetical protein